MASLGSFSKLPPEIRSLIWNEFVPSQGHIKKTDLSILRASKQLNMEIICQLHKVFKSIAFFIRSEYDRECTGFEMRVAECRTNAPRWTFVGAEDAMARGFGFLPLHILPTVVYIEPPNPNDPGQLICICERLQRLVQLLQEMKRPIKSLTIDLVDQTLWVRGGRQPRLNFSIPFTYTGDIGLTFIQSDVDAVLFPFHILQNVQNFHVANKLPDIPPQRFSTTKEWLDYVAESILPDPNPAITERHHELSDIFYFYLHLKMDILPGETASMLRLDRFAYWNERDYEKKFSRLVNQNPVIFQLMDWYSFENTRRRYSFAHILRHIVSGKSWHRLRRLIDGQLTNLEIPADKWFHTFRTGILPFNCKSTPDDQFWSPFHEFATLMRRETIKRRVHLVDLPPDEFLNNILEADVQQAKLKKVEPKIEVRLMKEYGIVMNFGSS